jgi:hypothetical protein
MPNTSFSIRNDQTGEETAVQIALTDDEWSRFAAYLEQADVLVDDELVQIGVPTSSHMSVNKETGVTFSVELPPWDQVIVLLHKLRPFILNDEYASFNRVTGIIGQRFEHPFFRRVLKSQRRLYDGRRSQDLCVVSSNGVVINSEQVLFDWLNAYEYHRDQDKKAKIESLHRLVPLDYSKDIFVAMLGDKTDAIINIAALVRVIMGKQERLTA